MKNKSNRRNKRRSKHRDYKVSFDTKAIQANISALSNSIDRIFKKIATNFPHTKGK